MTLTYYVEPKRLADALAALTLLNYGPDARVQAVRSTERPDGTHSRSVTVVVDGFDPAEAARRCAAWEGVLGLYGWASVDSLGGSPARPTAWPPPTTARLAGLLAGLERLKRAGGKGRGVEVRHDNSYGATDGWEVAVSDGGVARQETTGREVKDAAGTDEWPPLWAVLACALAKAGSLE